MHVLNAARHLGRAICVAPRILVTAAHVVANANQEDLKVRLDDGTLAGVIFTRQDSALDVAVLHIDVDAPVSPVRRARSGERWRAQAPDDGASADLSGVVTALRPLWRNALGHRVSSLQLEVEQLLTDFAGYSGGAIVGQDDGAVIAMLLEQQMADRGRSLSSSSVANVLYGVPIQAACDALGIEVAESLPDRRPSLPSSMQYHEDVTASLRGYRSRLTSQELRYVDPPPAAPWNPDSLWRVLCDEDGDRCVLLTGFGGVGKTRTVLEVGDIAAESGWDVVHVRGGNASRVADRVGELMEGDGSTPILLILDYLNLARSLDLLALTELAHGTSSSARLRILATSRTGWEIRHRQDPGISRFRRVKLSLTDLEAQKICRSIVEEIAPVASAQFGADAVLDVTGQHRPILAVLLGHVVETHVASTGTLPAALVSEDIASWLSDRLLEDDILPPETTGGSDLPEHILVAAACLASTPNELDSLNRIGVAAVPDASTELVAFTLDRLQKLGWLVDSEDGLAAAHDVVVDKILEAAVLHYDSGVVRRSALDSVLSTARSSIGAFTNVVAALERIRDEREARELPTINLRTSATEWLMGDHAIDTRLAQSDTAMGARAASQVIDSELWTNDLAFRWASVGSPLLEAVEHSEAAAEPLLAACRLLEHKALPLIGPRAINWLNREGTNTGEYVMNACLTRKDIPAELAGELLEMAVTSLPARSGYLNADFTLRRLLRRKDLSPDHLEVVVSETSAWMAVHGRSAHAVHLLSAVVDRDELRTSHPDVWGEAWELCSRWLSERPVEADGGLALESLIKTSTSSAQFERTLWPMTERWLSRHGTDPLAAYVLESLLITSVLPGRLVDNVYESIELWMGENLQHHAATFVLKPLLAWPHSQGLNSERAWALLDSWLNTTVDHANAAWLLRSAMKHRSVDDILSRRIWGHVRRWLLQHGARLGARALLCDALNWGLESAEANAVLWSCCERWLTAHLRSNESSYVFQSLLRWEGQPRGQANRVLDLASDWLEAHEETGADQSFILSAILRSVAPEISASSERFIDQLVRWLGVHIQTDAAGRVLRRVYECEPVLIRDPLQFATLAARWLGGDYDDKIGIGVMQAVVRAPIHSSSAPLLVSAAREWLGNHAAEGGISWSLLLQHLAVWQGASELWPLSCAHAGAHLTHLQSDKTGGFVIVAYVAAANTCGTFNDELWSGIYSWLRANAEHPYAFHSLQALLGLARGPERFGDELAAAVESWLSNNSEDARISRVLESAFASPNFARPLLSAVWPTTDRLFGALAARTGAHHLLQRIPRSGLLDDEQLSKYWICVSRWLDRFGSSYEATFLLQILLQLSAQQVHAAILWHHVDLWLGAHLNRRDSAYVLSAVMRWQLLSGQRANRTLEHIGAWLERHPKESKAPQLLSAVMQSPKLTNRQVAVFGRATRKWLREQAGPEARRSVKRGLYSAAVSKTRRTIALDACGLQ